MQRLITFFVTVTSLCCIIPAESQIFYKGIDVGYVNEIEACAGLIYKENDIQKDFYAIMADNGANIARIRLWHTRDNGWATYPDIKNAAIRAKEKGMAVLLDFHYSDTWADPGTQCTPSAWLSVDNNYPVLADSLYNYTYKVLSDLKKSNLTPEFVQVGNETNGGMCYGGCTVEWPNPWDKQTLLYNAGIQACRDVDPNINIILHVSDPQHVEWWVGELFTYNVTDFDVVGISAYPCWHNFTIEGLQDIIVNVRNNYNKDVMVVETSVSWTDGWVDDQPNAFTCLPDRYKPKGKPISPSPEIASQWCVDLADAIYASGGIGLIYWGGEWVATEVEGCPSYSYEGATVDGGSSWENNAMFDFSHNLLDPGPIDFIQKTYGSSGTTYTLTTNVTGQGSVSPANGTYDQGTSVELTATPSSGWQFDNWSGDVSSNTNPISITMDADKLVTATFTEINTTSAPGTFNLISPLGSTNKYTPTYDWEDASGADTYNLIVADNSQFSNPLINESNIVQSNYTGGTLDPNTIYYWKVIAENQYGTTQSNEVWEFTTRRKLRSAAYILAVEEVENRFSIFPNPTHDGKFNITFSEPFSGKIHLINAMGVTIKVWNIKESTKFENTDILLISGIYSLIIESDNSANTYKLIVE